MIDSLYSEPDYEPNQGLFDLAKSAALKLVEDTATVNSLATVGYNLAIELGKACETVNTGYLLDLEDAPRSRFALAHTFIFYGFYSYGSDYQGNTLAIGKPNWTYLNLAKHLLMEVKSHADQPDPFTNPQYVRESTDLLLNYFDLLPELMQKIISEASIGWTYCDNFLPVPPEIHVKSDHGDLEMDEGTFSAIINNVGGRGVFASPDTADPFDDERVMQLKQDYLDNICGLVQDPIVIENIWNRIFAPSLNWMGLDEMLLANSIRKEEIGWYDGLSLFPLEARKGYYPDTRQLGISCALNRICSIDFNLSNGKYRNDLLDSIKRDMEAIHTFYKENGIDFYGFDFRDTSTLRMLSNIYGVLVDMSTLYWDLDGDDDIE